MEDPRPKMQAALKQAMVNKDVNQRETIRMVLSAIKQSEIDNRKEVTADDVVSILQREVKTRRESLLEAENAGRGEAAAQETERIAILESFMPPQLTREEIADLVKRAIEQTGATSSKDMGKLMAVLMPKVKGVADGKLVNEVVRGMLSS